MGKINYKAIYDRNKHGWYDMTEDPQKYEALLAGHYSDSNHFVYELLQNAEDAFEVNEKGIFDPKTCAHADKVVIEYYQDKLVFYHNGKTFDEDDARGVSSMLMGTKDKDDAQTIGRFGMGFKSVFKYTYQPEIYSDDEAFKITRYLLPVEVPGGWDYETEKKSIVCKLGDNKSFVPFSHEKHLTKIVIPFKKYGRDGNLVDVPGDDVLKKLDELDGEILLFLTHIQNLYWINKETGKFAYITLKQDEKDNKLITCRIEGTDFDGKEDISRYLKFRKVFDHPEMNKAEVSVAYKLNSRADNINEVEDSSIWVYFPTRDKTDLPFLIHGSFETAVSREKLMTPSSFNGDLFDALGDLIAESMIELADRKLITQMFLRRIVLAAFEDEYENDTIPGLKEKVTEIIKDKGLVPDKNGTCRSPEEMYLPLPFRMAEFSDKPLLKKAFGDRAFVAFNNENEKNFVAYYNWLKEELGFKLYCLSNLADDLSILDGEKIPGSGEIYSALKEFYDFLSDNREAVYETNLTYSRSSAYLSAVRQDIKEAWVRLRKAPIILNRFRILVPAEKDGKSAVYLASSSVYKSMMQSELVDKAIAESFKKVLSEGFQIKEFNNFQYIKEKVIKKYIDIGDCLEFVDSDNFTKEYIEDLNQIFALIRETGDAASVRELLKDAYIIKTKPNSEEDDDSFNKPGCCHIPRSSEGLDLNLYYEPIPYDDYVETDDYYDFGVNAIDSAFYEENGISIGDLSKLGLITSPIKEGRRRNENGTGDNYWVALGDYCPEIEIDGLEDNLEYIEKFSDQDLAKEKSAEILGVLLRISGKFKGSKRLRKNNPYISDGRSAAILGDVIQEYKWLYDKDMKVQSPKKMSRHDLNAALYGGLIAEKKAYEILGFIKKAADETEVTFLKAANLNAQDKKLLVKQLARELGLQVTEAKQEDDWDDDGGTSFFNPNAWQDDEFPINKVNNIDYLLRHVREQFFCADPVTYKKVLRQIRVSKNSKTDRSYAMGMYTNSSNTRICQICQKPIAFTDVVQIANFGIEMPQLNLCLCRDCSARYSAMRDGNREEYKEKIRKAILSLDADEDADDYSIEFNADMTLHFTQTHLAEIQEIFRLLAEYGTPVENADDENDDNVGGPLMHPARRGSEESVSSIMKPSIVSEAGDVAKAGCFISYKKKFGDYEIYDNTLQPERFPLHKALEGHKVGDVIVFQGKEYEIIGL